MMLLLWAVATFLAILPVARGQNFSSGLPTCAAGCIQYAIFNATCDPTDKACVCQTATLDSPVTDCMLALCKPADILDAINKTSTLCDLPTRNESRMIITILFVFIALALASVFLRILVQITWFHADLGWDDWTIVTAVILASLTTAAGYGAAKSGLGTDIWDVPDQSLTTLFQYIYAAIILYTLTTTLNKISILCFYLRIFPSTSFRITAYFLIVFTVLSGIAFVLVNALQCQPISFFWTQLDQEKTGHCISLSDIAWAHASVNVFLGVVILIMPFTQLGRVHLHWRKKLGVTLMFVLGSFVTFISILRVQSIPYFKDTLNPSYDFVSVTVWTVLEVDLGIICLSMPAFRVLLTRVAPSLWNQPSGFGTMRSVKSISATETELEYSKRDSNYVLHLSYPNELGLGEGFITWEELKEIFSKMDTKSEDG